MASEPFIPTKDQREDVGFLINRWRPLMFLHGWEIIVAYKDFDDPDQSAAVVHCQDEYLQATIDIYPRFFEETPDSREKIMVHELVHCVISEVQSVYRSMIEGNFVSKRAHQKAVERVTSSLTNVIYELRPKHEYFVGGSVDPAKPLVLSKEPNG